MTLREREDTIGAAREIEIVRNVDRRELARSVNAVKQIHHGFACSLVKTASGFVGEEYAGVSNQGSSEDDALLLATG